MPKRRMTMRKISELLRLHYDCKLSNEKIASALKLSKGSVNNTLQRFRASGLSWPLPESLSDTALEARLYRPREKVSEQSTVDFSALEAEMRRPHMTLQILWEEYHAAYPEGLGRTRFYEGFRAWRTARALPMKMLHKGGDKLFVDYSGDGFTYVDQTRGTVTRTELFVCSWGASSYCYAEASPSQKQEDFAQSHVRALDYFGCAPAAFVPDNLKSGVRKASLYEPTMNPLYAALAEHYGAAVLPARVRKPRDKGVVESNVLHLQRFLFGRLRNRTFYSLAEINQALAEELEHYNARAMKDYGGQSRRERFALLDKPFARALPEQRFAITAVKCGVRVAPNYHIQYRNHHYSLPCELARQAVDVYQYGHILEIYHDGNHVCRHQCGRGDYGYTTREEHMPENHRYVRGWSPEYFLAQAEQIGPSVREAVRRMMEQCSHPEQGYKAAMGLLRLSKSLGSERVEKAARRALHFGFVNLRSIKSVLDNNLEDQALSSEDDETPLLPQHDNLRGSQYYAGHQPSTGA